MSNIIIGIIGGALIGVIIGWVYYINGIIKQLIANQHETDKQIEIIIDALNIQIGINESLSKR